MQKLVKTLTQEVYLIDFRKEGQVFLQPLSYYREIEDNERVDTVDGLRGYTMRPKETIQGKSEDFNIANSNIIFQGGFLRFEPGSNGSIYSAPPDVYVFCVAEEHLPRYGDYYYKIKYPHSFGLTLAEALTRSGKKVLEWKLEKVQYGNEKDDITTGDDFTEANKVLSKEATISDYFKKPTDYAKDQEWRYVFIIENDTDVQGGLLVRDRRLLSYCDV